MVHANAKRDPHPADRGGQIVAPTRVRRSLIRRIGVAEELWLVYTNLRQHGRQQEGGALALPAPLTNLPQPIAHFRILMSPMTVKRKPQANTRTHSR